MKKYVIAGLIIIFMLWIGFATKDESTEYPPAHQVLNSDLNDDTVSNDATVLLEETILLEETDMELYLVQNNYKPSLYEPSDGCYIGAYVLGNNTLNYDMMEFEKAVNKRHSTYIYNLILGNQFPKDWVLECIANMKTPLIVVHPKDGMILDENLLYDVAKSFGELSVPIFVEFYPNPEKYNIFPKEYKDFFLKAKDIFKNYSPNSAFVWSVNINNVYDSGIYYPGDNAVDWVGLSIYEPVYRNGIKSDTDIWSGIDFFYNTYQKSKPIMITELGISHYSNTDHTYYIQNSQNKINEFYNNIKNNYPRIKAVNYMDFESTENYKVTDNSSISKTYKSAVDDKHFKYSIDTDNTNSKEFFKSAFPIYKSGEKLYISSRTLDYELNIVIPQDNTDGILYNNIYYYPLDIIKKYGKHIIEIKDKKIYINVSHETL